MSECFADRILQEENDLIQAFADDQIILFSGPSVKLIEAKWEAAG